MNTFTYSKSGLQLTASFESCKLTAYRDSGGVLTVGWGHTGPDVYEGMTITQDNAMRLLIADIGYAERTVNMLVTYPALTQGEYDALVDFVFNVGATASAHSTLLRELNVGNIQAAADESEAWDHVAGGCSRTTTQAAG